MPKDLVNRFCKGAGKDFRGSPCDHYDPSTNECRLLRQGKTKAVFDHGRCEPVKMLRSAVAKYMKHHWSIIEPKAHQQHAGDPTYEDGYATFISDRLLEKLRDANLKKGYTLPVLIGYIRKASRNEVKEIFLKEELRRKACDQCAFLSQSKPHVCQKPENRVTTESGEEVFKPNKHYGKKRNPSDRACEEGFTSFTEETLLNDPTTDESGKIFFGMTVMDIHELLNQRIEWAKDKNTKKRYKRQHAVFTELLHLIDEGESNTQAKKQIADILGKDEKTIRNDLEEIKAFLKKKFL